MDYSPTGSSVHGIYQARIIEWVVISFSRGSPAGRFFTTEPPEKPVKSILGLTNCLKKKKKKNVLFGYTMVVALYNVKLPR